MTTTQAAVVAVSRDGEHRFSKSVTEEIVLVAGVGVEGDAHAGVTVQHRSRVAADPSAPNLRQVHLLHTELLERLHGQGFDVSAGQLGENVTTRGVDLLALPRGTLLRLGQDAVVEVTGLRNPCRQIQAFSAGLLEAVTGRDTAGRPAPLAGIMGVVAHDGTVRAGDPVTVVLPAGPQRALRRV